MALTGTGSEAHSSGEGKRNSAIAIIKHEMWRAPLESYGVLWEFMGGIYHINFLVRRSHWALWAAVLSSAGVGEGRKSRITVVHCSRQCTQNVTEDWPCQMLRANVSAFKRRAHGLGLQSKTPILGHRTFSDKKVPGRPNESVILPGKAVPQTQPFSPPQQTLTMPTPGGRLRTLPFTWASGPS